ncbi:uncharacterized protein LOC143217812 [Lasioglossum baleicum]|uniref:uncharacterized protein LOC143209367 n=1 Tax=Lasioglossum baleicum TaxID=434251 RepID=UPI003FCEA0E0
MVDTSRHRSTPGLEKCLIVLVYCNSDNLSDECIFTKNIYTQMETPTNTWTVVQFLADGTVEAVPNSWLEDDKCYWPPVHKSKLSNAIQQCELPQPSWEHFSVKIFKNSTFDGYTKARRKAKEAEETNDLFNKYT